MACSGSGSFRPLMNASTKYDCVEYDAGLSTAHAPATRIAIAGNPWEKRSRRRLSSEGSPGNSRSTMVSMTFGGAKSTRTRDPRCASEYASSLSIVTSERRLRGATTNSASRSCVSGGQSSTTTTARAPVSASVRAAMRMAVPSTSDWSAYSTNSSSGRRRGLSVHRLSRTRRDLPTPAAPRTRTTLPGWTSSSSRRALNGEIRGSSTSGEKTCSGRLAHWIKDWNGPSDPGLVRSLSRAATGG